MTAKEVEAANQILAQQQAEMMRRRSFGINLPEVTRTGVELGHPAIGRGRGIAAGRPPVRYL